MGGLHWDIPPSANMVVDYNHYVVMFCADSTESNKCKFKHPSLAVRLNRSI